MAIACALPSSIIAAIALLWTGLSAMLGRRQRELALEGASPA